ncbi:hypothetical protein GCM10010305_10230 [Streptomyces termitum]|uniref:Uncharacterized protein n=1 Tax=Streptomyces termitum TaxID=67368 RepID=A0A918SUS2_9ACTN|nr:hypothetical protein GCM10010305_10230 [Streptomyces termitum]
MSGWTRMCAAMSLYDQRFLSDIACASLTPRAAQRWRGCRSGALRAMASVLTSLSRRAAAVGEGGGPVAGL